MKTVVIGGGSVGLLLAARLQLGGVGAELITRSEAQAIQLNEKGVTICTIDGNQQTVHLIARPFTHQLPPADYYLLAIKQPDLLTVLPGLRSIPPTARVIALQNGIGHQEILAEALHDNPLFFAVNTEGAHRLSATEVAHTGTGTLRIGPWNNDKPKDLLLQRFIEAAAAASIPALYVEEISGFVWRKVIANAVINPLTTLFEVTNGELLQSSVTLTTMRQVFEEAAAIATCFGQKIDEQVWQELLSICRSTSRNHSSMLQDFWHGKPTEIEAINGYLVNKGKELGMMTPMNDALRKGILLKSSLRLLKGEAWHGTVG